MRSWNLRIRRCLTFLHVLYLTATGPSQDCRPKALLSTTVYLTIVYIRGEDFDIVRCESGCGDMSTHWEPCGLLGGKPVVPYAILILNQPINKNALDATIGGASLLVCADGGANRLRDLSELKNGCLPDVIVGDLDSITPETMAFYEGLGVKIVKDPDQYSTDFTKSLKWIKEAWQSRSQSVGPVLDVIVLGGLGGRVDQGFSQIHHLYLADTSNDLLSGRIYLLSEQSLTFILAEGPNTISLEPGYFAENVGIIPVLGRCQLTTKGLEWDVEDWPTDFGSQVSTSNHIHGAEIEISFRGPRPLLTLELASQFAAKHPH